MDGSTVDSGGGVVGNWVDLSDREDTLLLIVRFRNRESSDGILTSRNRVPSQYLRTIYLKL